MKRTATRFQVMGGERAARPGVLALAAWALLAGGLRAASEPTLVLSADAEGKKATPLVRPGTGPAKPKVTYYSIFLRPNADQRFFLFVQNPTKNKRNLTVRLKTGEKFQREKAAELTVAKDEQKLVVFDNAPPPPPAATTPPAATNPPAAAAPGEELKPFQFMLELYDKDDTAVLEQRIYQVGILSPRDYLVASGPRFVSQDDRRRNEWSVTVGWKNGPMTPECPVSLELDPDRIPGLLGGALPGSLVKSRLNESAQQVRLFAHLPFQDVPEANGVVAVNADGFPRAFQFLTTFVRNGEPTPDPILTPTLHVGVRRYLKPGPKPEPVRVEVDNWALNSRNQVELGLDRTGTGKTFERKQLFAGVKEQHVRLKAAGPDGANQLRTEVKDWVYPLETADLSGTCALQIRVLDEKGQPVPRAPVGLTKVTLLDRPPEGVRLIVPTKVRAEETRLVVQATCKDPPDHIKQVLFYLAPPTETKVPKDVKGVPASLSRDRGGPVWSATLDLARAPRGPAVAVFAQFIDQVGQESSERAEVERVAPVPAKEATTGTITGRVVKGVAATPQPDLPVTLLDAMNKPVGKKIKTDSRGNYKFTDVPPGNYTVFSEDVTDKVQGDQAVAVEKGKETKAKDIELSRIRK